MKTTTIEIQGAADHKTKTNQSTLRMCTENDSLCVDLHNLTHESVFKSMFQVITMSPQPQMESHKSPGRALAAEVSINSVTVLRHGSEPPNVPLSVTKVQATTCEPPAITLPFFC